MLNQAFTGDHETTSNGRVPVSPNHKTSILVQEIPMIVSPWPEKCRGFAYILNQPSEEEEGSLLRALAPLKMRESLHIVVVVGVQLLLIMSG